MPLGSAGRGASCVPAVTLSPRGARCRAAGPGFVMRPGCRALSHLIGGGDVSGGPAIALYRGMAGTWPLATCNLMARGQPIVSAFQGMNLPGNRGYGCAPFEDRLCNSLPGGENRGRCSALARGADLMWCPASHFVSHLLMGRWEVRCLCFPQQGSDKLAFSLCAGVQPPPQGGG